MTREEMQRVETLEARIGYAFPDRGLALTALTHRSWVNENRLAAVGDNERLEFLGDAVVDLAVSRRLMEALPEAREGELSRLRASLVSTEALCAVADGLRLGELLRLGRGEELTGGRRKQSLLADGVEAVIGAIYLCDGMGAVMEFVDRHVLAEWDAATPFGRLRDHKTALQERLQATEGDVPRYRVISESGPEHDKVFTVEAFLGERALGTGQGRSKKEAEQAAARAALTTTAGGAPLETPAGTGAQAPEGKDAS